jgi:N-acetylmuramoyl-L-alanine amidase
MNQKETILLIDSGHGGIDPVTGLYTTPETIGKKTKHTNGKPYHGNGWFYEGKFNREFALEFMSQAKDAGFICHPVYHPWLDTPLNERPKTANEIQNKYATKALLLSFHSNAVAVGTAPQTSAEGVCAFVYKLGSTTAKLAEKITLNMQSVFDEYGSKRRSQLIHDNSLTITSASNMPSILFEIGFFDNPNNADLMMKPDFRKKVVKSMIDVLKTDVI